ncbi:hypothetical protein MKZ38_008983 [Zalerion maritima]|uniref:Uncharacterized protein n=1 Tax=Zalerion maritima TaxID=339359 RepID=A0AAD5WMH1_9PEZI|nr:hypothetical protein MKZ38_008983 [Zalerion maritima]
MVDEISTPSFTPPPSSQQRYSHPVHSRNVQPAGNLLPGRSRSTLLVEHTVDKGRRLEFRQGEACSAERSSVAPASGNARSDSSTTLIRIGLKVGISSGLALPVHRAQPLLLPSQRGGNCSWTVDWSGVPKGPGR